MAKLPEHMPLQVEKLFYDLQNRIMIDIVRRIQKMGKITSTADYQINKLQILGGTTEFIESEIKRITGMTDAEIWKLYDEVAEEYYTRNKAAYEQINSNFIPYEENEILQAWTAAIVDQTQNEIRNIARSMGMSIALGGGKKVFTPLAEYYQSYLDRACMDIVTGSFSYNTVLRRVVKEMTASGIRSVDYASGWSNRVTVAARRAVMTGVHQLSAKINEKVAKDLGTKDYEITWHAGARPDHWWGGKVYSYEDLVRICGLGTVTGLCGANCYHSYYAFVKGISVRTYTDEQLADMNAREQEVHTYHGKPYNAYEATQRQRQLESRMRAQRSKVKLLQQGKADPEDIMAARTRYLATLHEYQGFSKVMKLPEQMERVYIDGLGRIVSGRKTFSNVDKSLETAIIKEKKMYRRKSNKLVEPMPKKQLQKIVKGFRKQGGIIQMDETTDAYLKQKKAEAVTLNYNTILLMQKPGRAAVFEELIHATQWRMGRNDGSLKVRLICEIEAQEKLLKYSTAYKLTKVEISQTEKALRAYKMELEKLLRGGE